MSLLIESGVSKRILPEGVSQVHIHPGRAELGLGTRQSDAANNSAVVSRNETRGHLENEFFGNVVDRPSTTKIHALSRLTDGRVSVVGTPAGYWERGGLIVATSMPELTPEELHQHKDSKVPTIYPTQLLDETKLAYVGAKLGGLQVSHTSAGDYDKPIVIEHLTPDVYRPHLKMPRSVPLPHANFGNINTQSIVDGRTKTAHLEAEQQSMGPEYYSLLALFMKSYIQGILLNTEHDPDRIDVRPQHVEPYGYKVVFDISPSELTVSNNIALVSTVLDAQHLGYTVFGRNISEVQRGIDANGSHYPLKPQPASRDFMHIGEEGLLEVVKSPILYSHSGGMEAAGITLRRSPQFEPRYTTDEIEVFRNSAGTRIKSVIESGQKVG